MQTNWNVPMHTVGIDLGDRKSVLCRLNQAGEVVERRTFASTPEGIERYFRGAPHARIVMEVGTHSPWISRLLQELGHEVIVANPSKIRRGRTRRKSDRIDAEWLARQGRADPKLLWPITHRGERAQADLVLMKTRDVLVKSRSMFVSHVRGSVKSLGGRIPSCSTESFHRTAPQHIPDVLRSILAETIEEIRRLTQRIYAIEREIQKKIDEEYPEARAMQQIKGVGPITALSFALVVEDPSRFGKRRSVGAYMGLVPHLEDSGEQESELRISKAGNELCRKYLVQAAHYVLGPFGPDCDLRQWGMQMVGGSQSKKVKKRAVVAVARKLSVLMLTLWVSGKRYEPLFNTQQRRAA